MDAETFANDCCQMSTKNPSLYKRAEQWSSRERDGWRWKERPPHRNLTVAAVKHQENVGFRVKEDRFALEKVEKDLKVLDLFIQQTTEQSEEDDRAKGLEPVDVDTYEEKLRRIDTENIDDVMGMMNDCLAQKRQLQAQSRRRKEIQQQQKERGQQEEEEEDEGSDGGNDNAPSTQGQDSAPPPRGLSEATLSGMPSPSPPVLQPQTRPRQKPRNPMLPPPPMATPNVDYKRKPGEEEDRDENKAPAQDQGLTTPGRPLSSSSRPLSGSSGQANQGLSKTHSGVSEGPSMSNSTSGHRRGTRPSPGKTPNKTPNKNVNVSKGGAEEAKGPVMRCTFDVAKLDCLKRHEEALRKRHEAVKRERHQEEHARVFKARPVPRAVLEARFASCATPPNLLYYDDDETDSEADEEGYGRGPLSENGAMDLYHQLDRDDSEDEEIEEGLGEWEGRAPHSMPASGRGWQDGTEPVASGGLGLEGVMRPSLVSLCSGEVEGTLLERQRTWEAARELKLRHARALKELSTLVEVQGKPALVSTRGSWERTKLAAQGARLRALEQERERAELEELKQQVVRAKYKNMYPPRNANKTIKAKAMAAVMRRPLQHRRHHSEPLTSPSRLMDHTHASPHGRAAGQARMQEREEDGEELDEIQVMNGPSSATYMSPMERRKRQQEPFAQLLAEKPLNEVQRLLAEKFNLPGLSSQSHAEGPGKEKEKEKKGLSASRRGTQQSCVQAYSSPTSRSPEKTRGAKRRPRHRSDTATSSLSGLEAMLGYKPGSSTSQCSTHGSAGRADGRIDDEAWRAIMTGASQAGAAGHRKGSVGERVEKRLQKVYDYGMDALKAVFHSGTQHGPPQANGQYTNGQSTNGQYTSSQYTGQDRLALRAETAGSDGTVEPEAPAPLLIEESTRPTTEEGEEVLCPSVEMSDDEITRLINQFTGPSPTRTRLTVAPPPRRDPPRVSIRDQLRDAMAPTAPPSLQPYERYEQGFVHHFFDPTSTADKGRFRVYDARDFQAESMHRKADPGSLEDGVTLLLGKTAEPPHSEKVITIMFDRKSFSVEDAQRWWDNNRERFIRQ